MKTIVATVCAFGAALAMLAATIAPAEAQFCQTYRSGSTWVRHCSR